MEQRIALKYGLLAIDSKSIYNKMVKRYVPRTQPLDTIASSIN